MGLEPEELKKKRLCEKHFTDNDYKTEKKHYLKNTAAPKKYFEIEETREQLKLQTPTRTYSARKRFLLQSPSKNNFNSKKLRFEEDLENKRSQFINDIIDLPSELMTPRKSKMKAHIKTQRFKIERQRKRITALHEKNKKNKSLMSNVLPLLTILSPAAKTFVLMQLKGKSRKAWTSQEKELCLSFYYKSAAAYLFLRKKGVILPSVSTIRRWIGQYLFKTGFNDEIKKNLKLKCAMKRNERKCVLAFDEMSIKELVEYNKKLDLVEGFEDLGPLGRTTKTATHALVFSARGLFKNWKIPVSYFFSRGSITQSKLKDLIQSNLEYLIEIGFNPRVTVCDQGSNNRGALKILGVSEEKPYFYIKNYKIFAIFDVPYLFKSIRNNLLNAIFEHKNKIFNFDVIKKTFEIDQSSDSARALPKISERHLKPNSFEKMSCKLALQVFSKTMAAAIRTCVGNKQINIKEGSDTAGFVLDMNNLFDALNSERLFDKNPYGCGLSNKHTKVIQMLQRGKEIFSTMIKVSKKVVNGKIVERKSRPPCFEGMVQTINAVFALFEDEKKDNNSFILTKRLNQDFLENFFSVIRGRGGWNLNPSAKSFRLAFRVQTITGLLKPSKFSNCQEDTDNTILLSNNVAIKNEDIPNMDMDSIGLDSNSNDGSQNIDIESTHSSKPEKPQKSTLEECATAYYAGYLLKRIRDKFKCLKCLESNSLSKNILNNPDPRQLFLLHKNYGDGGMSLIVPSEEFSSLIEQSYKYFKKLFEMYKYQEFVGLVWFF